MRETESTTVPELHTVEIPLQRRYMQSVRPPLHWGEWLTLMEKAVTFGEKLGLLHDAFSIQLGRREYDPVTREYTPYTHAERLEFFFRFADGWTDSRNFDWRTSGERFSRAGFCLAERAYFAGYDRNGNRVERTESEQRQALARKAFDMLAVHFFRMPGIDEDSHNHAKLEYRWLEDFVFGPTFAVVQDFFKPGMDGFNDCVRIRNLSRRHEQASPSEKRAIEFLLKLANFLWRWDSPEVESWGKSPEDKAREEERVSALRAVVAGAKPWMIEILAGLRELKLLEKWLFGLDEPCLATLRKLALQSTLVQHRDPVTKTRGAANLDEACLAGSEAAWLIKRHELVTRAHERLLALREAERELEELTEKLDDAIARVGQL